VHFDPPTSIQHQYQHLIFAPVNPHYTRFIFDPERDAKRTLKELRQGASSIERAQKAALSP
jgi:hypothetical protein